MEPNVPELSPWAEIAAELRRIADDAEKLADQPAPPHFELNIQPYSADDYSGVTPRNRAATIAAVDAVAWAFLGKPAKTEKLSTGGFFRKVGGWRGRVSFSIYQSVADPDLIDKDEELELLRARVAELEARDATGYSREADDPTPVSGARVEPHVGGMTEGGLVDETEELTGAAITESCVITGWGGLCTTHQARHIASGEAECGCPVYPFAGRGDAADTIVDHRRDCPGHPYAADA